MKERNDNVINLSDRRKQKQELVIQEDVVKSSEDKEQSVKRKGADVIDFEGSIILQKSEEKLVEFERAFENIMIRHQNTQKNSSDLVDSARQFIEKILSFSMSLKKVLSDWRRKKSELEQEEEDARSQLFEEEIKKLDKDVAKVNEIIKSADNMRRELMVKFPVSGKGEDIL